MKRVQKQSYGEFCESKVIAWIYGVHCTSQRQGAVKVFNRTVQSFFTLWRTTKGKYNLKNLIMNFWHTRTIESIRLHRWLVSEQSWIMKIKIWFIKSKRTQLKEVKRRRFNRIKIWRYNSLHQNYKIKLKLRSHT